MTKKSIVFRGSVVFDKHPKNYLKDSINTVRNWFDGEIVISTWRGQEKHLSDINGIDKVVTLNDPGFGPIQNFKRQILSYNNGLNSCSGEMVLITRTDIIHRTNIFDFIDEDKNHDIRFKVLDKKILVGNMMSISPSSNEIPNTFRLCDWFHLGYRRDIENWGNILDIVDNSKITYTCTEKTWFIYFLIKNNIFKINTLTTESIDSYYWDYIISNFIIKNTKSTLQSFNMNWQFQPENIESYITEKEYSDQYNFRFKK